MLAGRLPVDLYVPIVAALVSITFPACSDEKRITGPRPFPDFGVTFFHVDATFDPHSFGPDQPPAWRITAAFDPGLDEDSVPRVTDDTVWLDDATLLPIQRQGRVRQYSIDLQTDAVNLPNRVIRIRPPAVERMSPLVPELSFSWVGRTGGDTLSWSIDSDLSLPLLLPTTPPDPEPFIMTWQAQVVRLSEPRITFGGVDLPERFQLPRDRLPADGLPFQVQFDAELFYLSEKSVLDSNFYHVTYHVSSTFRWFVEPSTAPALAGWARRRVGP